MKQSLFLFVCVFFIFAVSPAFAVLPTPLSGTWQNPEKNESGTLTVTILEQDREELRGTIVVTGSDSCKDPISFLGKILGSRITIASNAENVCGQNGVFSIEAAALSEGIVVGTFSYRWMGGVWSSGTFRLTPRNK
ncbi:MAG: hypothetical protein A3C93_02305 [Candidatus Lloydbacteria bacterium RIFCSPHIGHO2_02_FULL_54_17]|uniref:DUF2147 domain-containing protein n=1 Tax=Candidatus Lloydbacteria bacterium RIFCSPHIGHO2_02_FULL_54_17 TaxID=1798664 RepID=A0A1G2DDN3_9BACT|nr:MAG: hypothetical protein A2762_04605 [Candidatus Lloydbacteria bacterium RIFCSPHIGHO2_01_FULL_54_11]OGZ11745.1 MAG: hypothetical protein A3C93_02305 [Candidatus Lloydbacteria bacterium RIFCSPHIGHO2_02_FULL_54_17]OGZ14274.1 MAG: hypothetical protein A2948_01640 [Candidatus Lloydbacteria bacterium RIFCSPLOWO2_01_FULL_54_18]OGZ16618.1 MAG: hypothetical protein A3H76_04275 [Candidatus Lloydbacteria bacterium RIFCSPLOWO2_02_FULL_54_12]